MQAESAVIIAPLAYWLFLISLPVLLIALWTAPWRGAQADQIKWIWPVLCAVIFLLWQMDVSLMRGLLQIHLSGACLLTVLFGWQLALIGLSSVLLATALLQELSVAAVAIQSIGLILVPVFSSYLIVRLVFNTLPRHFFIFIFLSGFANAMISIVVSGLAMAMFLQALSSFNPDQIWYELFPSFTLMLFPEAFTTGAILTLFVVYRPEWVRSFHDHLYLNK